MNGAVFELSIQYTLLHVPSRYIYRLYIEVFLHE